MRARERLFYRPFKLIPQHFVAERTVGLRGHRLAILPRECGNRYHGCNLVSNNHSLSEFVVLSAVAYSMATQGSSAKVASACSKSEFLKQFCPWMLGAEGMVGVTIRPVYWWDCGGGHIIHRLHRMLGVKMITPIPKGSIMRPHAPNANVVAFHPAVTKWGHCKERRISPRMKQVMRVWRKANPELTVLQLGHPNIRGIADEVIQGFENQFNALARADRFIGIPAGWMHLAAAWSIPSVIALQGIKHRLIQLPAPRTNRDRSVLWLYPQNGHIGDDSENARYWLASVESIDSQFRHSMSNIALE